TPLRRWVNAEVVYDPAENGIVVAHDLDALRLAENSWIHAERLVSRGDLSVLLECVSVEPAYYPYTHVTHPHAQKRRPEASRVVNLAYDRRFQTPKQHHPRPLPATRSACGRPLRRRPALRCRAPRRRPVAHRACWRQARRRGAY